MASIWELNQRISFLINRNSILHNEFDEYTSLKSALTDLIEAHLARRKQDRALLGANVLQPSRCVNSFLREFNSQLNNGSDRTLSNYISALTGNIIKKQHIINQEIHNNENEIRSCRNRIYQLQQEAARAAEKNNKDN